jgi:hypothetical protein
VSTQTIGGAAQRTAAVPRARAAVPPAGVLPPAPEPAPRVPSQRRIAGLCGWAALLGFLGLVVGTRGLIAILVKAPPWYEPTLIALGLVGIALAAVAFLTVHYRYTPWLFLTLSSGALLASIIATGEAT